MAEPVWLTKNSWSDGTKRNPDEKRPGTGECGIRLLAAARGQYFTEIVMAPGDALKVRVTQTPGILNFARLHAVKVANHQRDLAILGVADRLVHGRRSIAGTLHGKDLHARS